ncbi:MAG TPA: hypothetical protein VM694_35310 [Polyangium sp.]|nr:hypothetical protein [Polyangium sp.]
MSCKGIGGIVALWVRGLPFSISAGVGFVALSGVSVLADMVLVSTSGSCRWPSVLPALYVLFGSGKPLTEEASDLTRTD